MIKVINEVEVREVNGLRPGEDRPLKILVESHPLNELWSTIRINGSVINVELAVKTDDLIRAAQNSANQGTTDFDDHMKKHGLKQPF